ncbi:MAG: NADH-quinone oxidoreductase subunit B [Acidimicrobiales bacterium]
MGLEDLQHNFLTGRLEDLVKWARTYSMWPATFGLACCAIEMMSVGAADFDLARFGMEVFRASPRQADLMIVAGRVSQKMAPVLRQVYDQMMEPKWVLSMGVCASSGGMFNNYAIVQGVDQIVPVDVYAPGCPPTPETLMHAILTLHEKVRTNQIARRSDRRVPAGAGGTRGYLLANDQGGDTDDGRTRGDEETSAWTPDRPDAVHLATPKRNPVIARSVGEPL